MSVKPVRRGGEPQRTEHEHEGERLIERKIAHDEPLWIMRDDGVFEAWDLSTDVGPDGKKRIVAINPDNYATKVLSANDVLTMEKAVQAKVQAVKDGKSHDEAIAIARGILGAPVANKEQPEMTISEQAIKEAAELLDQHRASGKPIMVLTKHGLKEMTVYSLVQGKDGMKFVACEDGTYCTDTIPVRVYLEDMRLQRVPKLEAVGAGAGSPPVPPSGPEAREKKKTTTEPALVAAAAGLPPTPPVPPRGNPDDFPAMGRNGMYDLIIEEDGGKGKKKTGKEKIFRAKVGAADISEEIENRARDVAEEKMAREKEQLRGFTGWLSRTFKHNYGREIYRQIEIRKAREAILREGNLYVGDAAARDAHVKATNAVVDRIVQDYEEFIHEDAGEKREKFASGEAETAQEKAIKVRLTNIIKAYAADPSMSREDFEEAKKRIFHDAAKLKKTGGDGRMYADNVTEIAERLREHAAHAGGLKNVDLDLDFTIAKAKLGARTEREGNNVDWALEKMRKLSGGLLSDAMSNEIAVAVGAAYAGITYAAQRGVSSTLASWATFGASAGLAGLVAGYKEKSRMTRERVLHERQRAVGSEIQVKEGMTDKEREVKRLDLKKQLADAKWSEFGKKSDLKKQLAELDRSPRRLEMEQHLREKASAVDMTTLAMGMLVDNARAERLTSLDKKSLNAVASGEIVLRENTPEAYAAAVSLLAEIEARIRLSNTKGVDLLSYSDVTEVEAERRDLDYARALLKAVMRRAYDSVDGINRTAYPTFDAYLEKLRKDSEVTLYGEKSMNVKNDKAFNRLATKKALWTGTKVAVGAMVIGGAVHEAVAFFGDNGPEIDPTGVSHSDVSNGGEFILPDGVKLEELVDGSSRMVAKDGSVIVDGLHTPGGVFDAVSEAKLNALGIYPHDTLITIDNPVTIKHGFSIPEWLGISPDVIHAKRDLWYGNDTKIFDLDELKLWWGGHEQIGTNANGDFVMSMSHMKPGESFNTPESVNPFSALHEGKLKLLLSLTEGTQNRPVELDINPDGTIIIPKDSDIAKSLFRLDGGKPVFLGRFAEIAEVRGIDPDGTVHYGILATHEGKGVSGMIDSTITINECIDKPVTEFDFENKPNLPPLVPIPVSWRTPLEPMKKSARGVEPPPPPPSLPPGSSSGNKRLTSYTEAYGYGESRDGGNPFGLINRNQYRERLMSELQNNKEYDTAENEGRLIEEYLNGQDPEYLRELQGLVAGAPLMKKSVELSITVPAYSEENNIEKTIRYYATLKNPERFELVILENHPANKKRDKTGEVIERMRKEFPQLNLVHLYKQFANKPAIGNVRKFLVDSVLLRRQMAEIDHSVAIASNDADLEGISPNYANDVAEAFRKDPKLDAVAGRWDFPRETYRQYLDIAFRNYYLNSPELIGRNSAFRAGTYAAIGGYGETSQLAEDLEIGWMIKDARGYDADRIQYLNKAKLVSNPRRAVVKLLSGGRLVQQYGDFHVNEEVRKAPLEELLKEKRDFKPEEFAHEVQAIYDHYIRMLKSKGGWVPDDLFQKSFSRAMGMLGVKFKLENDQISVSDMSKLTDGLESYGKKEE